MILNYFPRILKNNTMDILRMSIIVVMMVTGSCATAPRVILQGHNTSTLTGQRLMLDHQTLGKQIESSITFGKRALLMQEAMECVISKTDALVSPSWHLQKQLIKLQYLKTHDLAYYQSLVAMLRKCSQTRLYLSQQIIRSSSNQYKMEWNAPKRNYRTRYRREGLQESRLQKHQSSKLKRGLTQQSIGKTQATTHMTGKN